LAAVLSRTMDTLMGRVRDEMVEGLIARHDRDRVAFMHLTRGLDGHDEPFLRADGKPEQAKVRGTATSGTDFGVDPKFQGLLSRIRTDLDSFTDIEAFALEADGYRMSGPELTAIARNFGSEEVVSDSWPFARMGERLSDAFDTALSKHLEVASHKLAKPYRVGFSVGLAKALGLIGVSIIALVALVAYLFLIWYLGDLIRPGWLKGLWDFLKGCLLDGDTALGILVTIILGFFSNWVGTAFKALRILRWPPQFVLNMFTKFILPALAALPIVIYLLTIDRYFVRVLGR
jgi:NTE family protein